MSSVHTLGVPIRSVNWVRIFPVLDAEGRDCLVAVMGQQADGFMVVKIDPVTGDTDPVTATDISAINALVVSEDGLLYGTALGDEGPVLFAFDPVSRAFLYAISLDGRPSGPGASEWTR